MLNPRFKNLKQMVTEFYEALESDHPMVAPTPQNTIERQQAPRAVLTESAPLKAPVLAERAHLSKYSSQSRALDSFRVLAGLEYREISPWNPGIVGETRTVAGMKRDFNMTEDVGSYKIKPDLGGHSPKAVSKALSRSHRVLSSSHAFHSYMDQLEPHEQMHHKEKLAAAHMHASHALRGAADGAAPEEHEHLHGLASRHERHAKIYSKGGRPKLEAVEEMLATVASLTE